MKKLFATLAALAVALGAAYAQDLASATELYNAGAEAISTDKASALKSFEQALEQASALGEEGAEIVKNCKNIIPNLTLSIAKDFAKESKFDEALVQLDAAVAAAAKHDAADVASEAKGLIAQIKLNTKDYDGAAAAYKEILDADPSNGNAALRLGVALNGAGKTEEAKAAFEQAAANGQEANANKQLGSIYLKEAAAALKEKKYADAVAAAAKVNDYTENAQAWQIAGQASQVSGKNNDAIMYFEKYLEAAPTASNAGQVAYTVGVLYQQAKNNAKAKEFYAKAVNDPKYGAEAKKMLDALK